jgi:hybrid cluster-associated redox disulfide protein
MKYMDNDKKQSKTNTKTSSVVKTYDTEVKTTSRIKIDPTINISEFVETYPQLVDVLAEFYGFHCVNCMFSDFDTLIEGAAIHSIEGKDFEEMVEHLEKIINGEEEIKELKD